MRPARLFLAVTAFLVTLRAAPAPAQGVDLSWDDCYLGSGQMLKTFACDTDAGPPFTLVGSVVPGTDTNGVNGMIAIFDLCTMPYALPDWWRVGQGDCRQGDLSVSYDFTGGPFSCVDPWQGQAIGGFSAQVATLGATRLRLTLAAAVNTPVDLTGADTYYLFKVAIARTHTSGEGACAGCLTNACLVLNEVRLSRPVGQGDIFIYSPSTDYYAMWQGINQAPQCPFVVPTRTTSWGLLKSMYH